MIQDRIIVALDVDSLDSMQRIVGALRPLVSCFKVGLELITALGAPQVVNALHAEGASIFFDGKFNDIPNTVGQAARQVSQFGVKMFDVHASTGESAMKAANENKGKSLLLAVTVLTSFDDAGATEIFGAPPDEKVLKFAWLAKHCGVDGVICSPKELTLLNQIPELKGLIKVTPGVRPAWANSNDQKRATTPAEAVKLGADYLVIGRPITQPPKEISTPLDAVKKIFDEIEGVHA